MTSKKKEVEKDIVKVKTCPFGCKVANLQVWDRGRFIECVECGIRFTRGLEAWNKRKRGNYLEVQY